MMTTIRLLWIIYVVDYLPAGLKKKKKELLSSVTIEVIDLDHGLELGLLLYKHGREDCI